MSMLNEKYLEALPPGTVVLTGMGFARQKMNDGTWLEVGNDQIVPAGEMKWVTDVVYVPRDEGNWGL